MVPCDTRCWRWAWPSFSIRSPILAAHILEHSGDPSAREPWISWAMLVYGDGLTPLSLRWFHRCLYNVGNIIGLMGWEYKHIRK